ncbi:hypothetical protein M8C21_029479, partial [Ambrosia artemisiifolia]
EDILRDVWFPATIVEYMGKGLYLVEYNCSGSNDESALQRDSDSDDDVHDELRENATLNVTNPTGDTLASIDKQTCVTRSTKRSKATNPGSNDKLITPCKKLKSNGVPSKEVNNQSVDKTKRPLRGKKTPAKQDSSVDLKRPMITSARKKGKLSANSRGLKALVKAAGDLAPTTTPNTVKGKRVIKKSKQLIALSPQNVGEPEEPQSSVPLASKTTDDQGGGRGVVVGWFEAVLDDGFRGWTGWFDGDDDEDDGGRLDDDVNDGVAGMAVGSCRVADQVLKHVPNVEVVETISRMKELLRWVAAAKSEKGGKYIARKGSQFRNKVATKTIQDDDQLTQD